MNTKEALSILKPTDKDSLKQAYRSACFKFHPDHGGDPEIMKLVNLAFECLNNYTWGAWDAKQAQKETPLTETLTKVWNKVNHFPYITGEIVGTWIWVSGESWRYKKQLKELGFKWSPNKRAWFYHAPGYRKRSKRSFDMDEIRGMFDSSDLETEQAAAVA